MINRVILIGNLGKDPEPRQVGSQQVVELRVATSRSWTDKQSGQRKEETEWHIVEVWGKQGDACMSYLAKGRQVFVEGRIKTDSWEKEGQKKERVKIVAENVRFLSGEKAAGGGGRGSSSVPRNVQEAADVLGGTATPGTSDDIPF